jgi:hypothetical protein
MALHSKRFIDYGTGTNQVHLGVVPDSSGSDKAALTDAEQNIGGLKIFSEIVTSPNSPATLGEIEDNNEFVTFEQFEKYSDEKEEDLGEPTVLSPGDSIAGHPERTTHVIDRETGIIIGTLPSVGSPLGAPSWRGVPDSWKPTQNPNQSAPASPPHTLPKLRPRPDSGSPGVFIIPPGDGKAHGIVVIGGNIVVY